MVENGSKIPKNAHFWPRLLVRNWLKMRPQNAPKSLQIPPKWPRNGPELPFFCPLCPKWPFFSPDLLCIELMGDDEEHGGDLWAAVTFAILFLLSLLYGAGLTLVKVPPLVSAN